MKKRKHNILLKREEKLEKLFMSFNDEWWNTFGCDKYGYYYGEKERFDFGTYEVNRDWLHKNHKVAYAILRRWKRHVERENDPREWANMQRIDRQWQNRLSVVSSST